MKHYTLLLYITAVLLSLTACKDGNAWGDDYKPSLSLTDNSVEQYYFKPSTTSLTFSAQTATQYVKVESSTSFIVQVSDTWLTVMPTSASGTTTLQVTVEENNTAVERTATISLLINDNSDSFNTASGSQTRSTVAATITVKQGEGDAFIIPGQTALTFTADASTQKVAINTNVSYNYYYYVSSVSSEGWLNISHSNDFKTLTVTAEKNTNTEERTATIYLTYGTVTRSSASATIQVTQSGLAQEDYIPTTLYYVGDATSWNYLPLSSKEEGKFVGYYYIYKTDDTHAGFKFCAENDGSWTHQYGKGNGDYQLSMSNNVEPCSLPSSYDSGFYQIIVDTNAKTYSLTPITVVSVIGAMTGWANDYDMTFNTSKMCWEGTFNMTTGEYKFRANHDWQINWGGTANNLTLQGDNLTITTEGNYTFELYPYCDGMGHVYITRNSSMTSGSGTLEDPFNVAAALALTRSLGADVQSEEAYYIKGIITSISDEYESQYGNAAFYISDDGTTTGQLYVYRAYYLENQKWKEGNTQIKVGDEVIIYGKLIYYKGKTSETPQGQAYLYSLNGKTSDDNQNGEGQDSGKKSLANFTNGDFETWEDGLPKGWKSESTVSNATLSQSTDAHGGSYSVQVQGTTTVNKRLAYQEMELEAGTYSISFFVKALTSGGGSVRPGYVPVIEGVVGSYVYGNFVSDFSHTEWKQVTFSFVLSSKTVVCLLIMNAKNPGTDVLIDDFTIVKE